MRWQLLVAAIVVLLASAPAAPAYTLVLRGGDRVDIGEFYWITGSTVTWVTPQGERRSVDLGRIDLDATAYRNDEAIATFVDRAIRRGSAIVPSKLAVVVVNPAAQPQGEHDNEAITVTTADLVPLRDEREAAARLNPPSVLPALGIPRNDDRDEAAAADVEYRWREEARALREELDVEQAQIDALRDELAYREANPRKFRLNAQYNFGRGSVYVDRRGGYGYTTGSTYNRADDEFAQMSSRLIDLEIQHRGTQSRWDAFVERARRAGVPPGWLRQ